MTDAERVLRECVRLWQNALDIPGAERPEHFLFEDAGEPEAPATVRVARLDGDDPFPAPRDALAELERAGYIGYTTPPGPSGAFALTTAGKRFGLKLLGRQP